MIIPVLLKRDIACKIENIRKSKGSLVLYYPSFEAIEIKINLNSSVLVGVKEKDIEKNIWFRPRKPR